MKKYYYRLVADVVLCFWSYMKKYCSNSSLDILQAVISALADHQKRFDIIYPFQASCCCCEAIRYVCYWKSSLQWHHTLNASNLFVYYLWVIKRTAQNWLAFDAESLTFQKQQIEEFMAHNHLLWLPIFHLIYRKKAEKGGNCYFHISNFDVSQNWTPVFCA